MPVFFIGERIQIGPYGLIDVHTQRNMELFCDSRDTRLESSSGKLRLPNAKKVTGIITILSVTFPGGSNLKIQANADYAAAGRK